jgi:DNA-binding CsgD family transcriptional regulator
MRATRFSQANRRRRSANRIDLLAVVEAIYRLDQPTSPWLHGILASLYPWLEDGLGIFAFTYAIDAQLRISASELVHHACSEEVVRTLPATADLNPEFVRSSYMSVDVGASSTIPGWCTTRAAQVANARGILDTWGILGRNWDHQGTAVIVARRRIQTIPTATAESLIRIAAHLAAAGRLRRRLEAVADPEQNVEAIVDPNGRVEYAPSVSRDASAIADLAQATRARESARGRLRYQEPVAALASWPSRVRARWTLVDQFESDGRRYVVARENAVRVPEFAGLTFREREILASVALGRTNKEVAYDLGLAHSTVRVLLARAARKLGVRDRAALARRFTALANGE